MHLRTAKRLGLIFCVAAMLAWTSGAMAILPEDYVAIRILEPPSPHPPADPDACTPISGQTCGAGPAFPAGISNDGDIAGHIETNFPHVHHFEEGIRWLRSTGYTAENIGKYPIAEGEVGDVGQEIPFNRAYGIHSSYISPGGFMVGASNVNNGHMYAYDITNNQWFDFGKGVGRGVNDNGHVLGTEDNCCGGPENGMYARVSDMALISEPFTVADRGELQRLAAGLTATAINNADIVVGVINGNPVKIEPIGEDQWGEPVTMAELGPPFVPTSISALSDSDPPFGAGTGVGGDLFQHAIVWNVNEGTIAADLGTNARAQRINSAGTIVVGTRTVFGFPIVVTPTLWWTDDNWENFGEINLNELLTVVPGGEAFEEIRSIRGVNDHGQIVGSASLKGDFGQLLDPKLTDWDADLALCGNISKGGCGVPYLLDTMLLDVGGVLKGDVNNDSIVDFLDITPFINAQSAEGSEEAFLLLSPDGCFLCADIDMDGVVDFIDITPFVNLLDEIGAAAVPEPSTIVMLALCLLGLRRRREVVYGWPSM